MYLDWFFLKHFGKTSAFWRELGEDEITALITIQNEKEKEYWETWQKLLKGALGGK